MEKIQFIVTTIFLCWALIMLYRVNSKLSSMNDEQKRHDNIQKVVLEQVDEINQKSEQWKRLSKL